MNLAEDLGELEIEVEELPEVKEKTISARLMLSDEQMDQISLHSVNLTASTELKNNAEEYYVKSPTIDGIQPKLVFTKEQKSDLLQAFNLLDHTGEGKIKTLDFRVAIKALGYEPTKEELQDMVNAVDIGGTGKLSFENFQTAIMRKIMSKDKDGDIMKSFRLFDIDDTGFISFENVKEVTGILGHYLTDEEIEEMIEDADKDLDGLVSVPEFMKMIKTCVHIVTP